ncbi:hypothetical protein D915_008599 [Fasciola hepatica]|uniref:Anaphase-promoting complex subunit 5 n=1 Tax=Fasciola hepatica TaxID=6192 RepID=A0A4E0RFJ7_FASHE|nr:hypothetical protein D915_008599 [Fasciola hepatica]
MHLVSVKCSSSIFRGLTVGDKCCVFRICLTGSPFSLLTPFTRISISDYRYRSPTSFKMPFYDSFLTETGFVDCVTPTNFVLYILLREYIGSMMIDSSLSQDLGEAKKDKVAVYMFFYKRLRDFSPSPFSWLCDSSAPLSARLQALVRGRIERLRNVFEVLSYTHPNTLKSEIFSDYLCMEDEEKFVVMKDSVFGLFLRKFALGFHHLSFEEMVRFLDQFFEAYDTVLQNFRPESKFMMSEQSHFDKTSALSTRKHALEASTKIVNSIGLLGGRPETDVKTLDDVLSLSRNLFPDLPAPYYAAHLLATRKRHLTEAESNLHAYVETRMAAAGLDKSMSNTCAYLSIAAAAMHLSFGQWQRSKCLEKEALKKSLESECKAPLNHIRVTHTLLSSNMEPFRYDGEIPSAKVPRSPHVALAEMRTGFWDMVDSGAPTKDLLTVHFNSAVAMSPTYFSLCLLDVATLWSLYGYPTLYAALLQCVVSADCLQPCPYSDIVLTTAFSGLIREYNAAGAITEALELTKACVQVLCRFAEKSVVRQAGLQVELEQAIRSQTDLSRCDRLINALRLCCPWEAALYQAEVERCRGNPLTSHDLLHHVVDSVSERLGLSVDTSDRLSIARTSVASTGQTASKHALFSRVQFPEFDRQIPVGGQAKLAQIGLRARLALVESLLSMGLCDQATKHLSRATALAERYRLELGAVTVKLLKYVTEVQLGRSVSDVVGLRSALHQILHRADRWTRCRCVVFAARVNLKVQESSADRLQALSSYLEQLFRVFQFYRVTDDRKRILDLIVLMASALHTLGRTAERNTLSRTYVQLRNEYQCGTSVGPQVHSLCLI